MAFKLSLVADVRQWLKGTADVEQSLDKLADGLDDLARDTKDNAGKAAHELEREFSDAFDKVKTESKQTGKKLGTDLDDGASKATQGVDDFKDEAKQSIRETAASFSDVTDALDLVQEVAANALVGFGPAGLAAGAMAAIGIGAIKSALDDAKAKADDYVDTVHSMATAMRDAGGLAEHISDSMQDIVDTKEWWEFWQNLPVDRLSSWSTAVKDLGVSFDDVFNAASGDLEAYDRVVEQSLANTSSAKLDETNTFLQSLKQQAQAADDAKRWNDAYADSTVAAHQRAAEASKDFSDNLTDHLSVADEGLADFVHKGKLNLKEWTDALAARAKETKAVQDFTVTIAPKLSPEALANFAQLPTETQAQIAAAFKGGSKKQQRRIVQNLEAEAKVTKVDINTSDAQKQASSKPIEIPTTVVTSGAVKGAQDAADDAQKVANREANKIEFKTKVNDDGLQAAVNRAAAAIHPPTIYVNVKAKKETP